MSARYRRSGIAGPVLLIALGVVFLLNNLGLLTWSVWDVILRLWPLLIVAWGLDLMLGRRSAWGAALALILILVLLGGGVFMMGNVRLPTGSAVDIDLPILDVLDAQISLDPALAYLRVRAADGSSQDLLSGRVLPFNGERVDQDVQRYGRRLEADIRTAGVVVIPFIRMTFEQASWDFSLHPGIEYDLSVDVGGGKTDLLIQDISVNALGVHTGIGQTIVYLPGQGSYAADIDGGLGQIVVYLPDDVGIRLSVDIGIGSINVPKDFRREGGAYVSPDYDNAEEHIEVDVKLGIGSIEVR